MKFPSSYEEVHWNVPVKTRRRWEIASGCIFLTVVAAMIVVTNDVIFFNRFVTYAACGFAIICVITLAYYKAPRCCPRCQRRATDIIREDKEPIRFVCKTCQVVWVTDEIYETPADPGA